MLFMGLDVGTQGVRCLVTNENGKVMAGHSVPFDTINASPDPVLREQDPAMWVSCTRDAIRACVASLEHPESIVSVSIDGTSGTILALDRNHKPLTPGIMYNDPRAREEAGRVHAAMERLESAMGYRFGSSFSLPRILWIHDHLPDVYEKTAVFAHQADYVGGTLTGEYAVSDYSNALKTGYDLINRCWPEEIETALGLDRSRLPQIVQPGAVIAPILPEAAEELGLPRSCVLTGGSTDGYASALAAGAAAPGRWASVLGTTLVLKGVTGKLIRDPSGASYSHRLPGGEWMPGGAANLGGVILNNAVAPGSDFAEMDRLARDLIPTGVRCYPLAGRGERFPFIHPDCTAFYRGDVTGGKLYPAIMEGIAFAERMALERMQRIGAEVGDTICTAGGACKSPLWLKIRASVLDRSLIVPCQVDAAMGSCLLSSLHCFGTLAEAAGRLLNFSDPVDPDPELRSAYEDIYRSFLDDTRKIYGLAEDFV